LSRIVILKGMTGALAPFSYLVLYVCGKKTINEIIQKRILS
jgi:hypothetical protein